MKRIKNDPWVSTLSNCLDGGAGYSNREDGGK